MNYIAEVNSFYNWVLLNSIPADAQALWHLLMQMNNRCAVKINNQWYWRVEFTVPNKTIVSILTFSRQQLDRMRNILIQSGRIEYKKGKGSQSGIYKIIPFDDTLVDNYVDNFPERLWITVSHNVTQSVTQPDTQTGHNLLHKADTNDDLCNIIGTLINNNKSNINNIYNNSCVDDDNAREGSRTKPLSDYLAALNGYFGISEEIKREVTAFTRDLFCKYSTRRPTQKDIINVFEHTFKSVHDSNGVRKLYLDEDKKEVLEYAFSQASDAGNCTWAYIFGVLDNIRKRGLKSQKDCIYYDADRDLSKNGLFNTGAK